MPYRGGSVSVIERCFLRAKHWQLFLLLVGVPVVGQTIVMGLVPVSAPSPQEFGRGLALLVGVTAIWILCLQGWFWSMGSFSSSMTARSHQLPITFFRLTVICPAAYIVILLVAASLRPDLNVVMLLFPLHIVATLCMLYNAYFVSKNLVLAESGRPVTFYKFSGPLILLWFFPIGVWSTQPRINELFNNWTDNKPQINTVDIAQSEARKANPGGVVSMAFIASMALALICALAVSHGYLGELASIGLCVGAQQLVFASAALRIFSTSGSGKAAPSTTSLVVICLMAMYFSVSVPALFTQMHTGKVVPNDPANLIFSIPAISLAIVMLVRARRRRADSFRWGGKK
jgi:hypothetical protein